MPLLSHTKTSFQNKDYFFAQPGDYFFKQKQQILYTRSLAHLILKKYFPLLVPYLLKKKQHCIVLLPPLFKADLTPAPLLSLLSHSDVFFGKKSIPFWQKATISNFETIPPLTYPPCPPNLPGPPSPPSYKKTCDLNFERRHAMPHVKATLFVFVPKQSIFFVCFTSSFKK